MLVNRSTNVAWLAACLALGMVAAPAAGAQDAGSPSRAAVASDRTSDTDKSKDKAKTEQVPAKTAKPTPALSRWIDLQTAQYSTRFRYVESPAGKVTSRSMQFRPAVKGRMKFDAKGLYSVNFGAFSGKSFTSGWNNSGVGLGDYAGDFALKQFYFAAQPTKGVEVQVGGLYFNRGEYTETISYDNDGYLVGERVTVKRPADLFFSEISFTGGRVGELAMANVFRRMKHFDEQNYWQALVGKKITKQIGVSGDFTHDRTARVVREGVTLATPQAVVVDGIKLELYQRFEPDTANGVSVSANRTLTKRFSVSGGFANVDPNFGGLNADKTPRGKFVFVGGGIKLIPELSISWWYGQAVKSDAIAKAKHRFDFSLDYNVLKTLQRTGLF